MKKPKIILGVALVAVGVIIYVASRDNHSSNVYVPRKPGTVTFNKDIAPIIFDNCSGCHRPGQSSPFPLLTFRDVQRRTDQIVEVTQDRYMPPWMPSPGHGEFADARYLTAEQLGLIQQWVSEGALEGDSEPPPLPQWPEGWHLGPPDLVITMTEPFTLYAEGEDLYRNFILPIPLKTNRQVRAIEFDPGNPRIVHHAFMLLDRTRQSRRRDEADPAPGYDGIHGAPTAQSPEGYFLSWQPGKRPSQPPEGFSWKLRQGTDMVLQLHLQPSGKPESIQSRVAIYFTDKPSAANPLKLWLGSYNINVPAGESDYLLEDSYKLPADADLLGILPHAHYLAREMIAFATLPTGERKSLLKIEHWDFNWQGDYRYAKPVFLPEGTTITMKFIYDNSTNNAANPNHPPQPVKYGLRSTDEMAELWLQVLPRTPAGRAAINEDYQKRVVEDSFTYNNYLLSLNPNDAHARSGVAKALYFQGNLPLAAQQFQTALQLDPSLDEPHYFLGLMFRKRSRLDDARKEFETTVRLNPDHARAYGNLGIVLIEQTNFPAAETALKHALALNPEDDFSHDSLGVALARMGRIEEAESHFRAALKLNPANPIFRSHLEAVTNAQ